MELEQEQTIHSDKPAFNLVIKAAVIACGEIISEHFRKVITKDTKSAGNDFVTSVDKMSQQKAIEVIRYHYPEHVILSEEQDNVKTLVESDYTWVIDPLDGTTNFIHGNPICCVSIALLHKGELILGAVYNPLMNELFFAEKGKGATLNERTINVSNINMLNDACGVIGFHYKWSHDAMIAHRAFKMFLQGGMPVKDIGSAALSLCWLACGRFDAFVHPKVFPWDVAAGFLIVQEAGGSIFSFSGNPCDIYSPKVFAVNSSKQMQDAVKNVIRESIYEINRV